MSVCSVFLASLSLFLLASICLVCFTSYSSLISFPFSLASLQPEFTDGMLVLSAYNLL